MPPLGVGYRNPAHHLFCQEKDSRPFARPRHWPVRHIKAANPPRGLKNHSVLFHKRLGVLQRHDRASAHPDALQADSPLRRNIRMLPYGRAWYGILHNPEPIVAEMFDAFPRDIDRVSFTMRVLKLDTKGILVAKDTRTECRRGEQRGEVKCVVAPVAGEHPPRTP